MGLNDFFVSVVKSILLSDIKRTETNGMNEYIAPLISKCVSTYKSESKESLKKLPPLIIDILDVLTQKMVFDLEHRYGKGNVQAIANHITKVFVKGQVEHACNNHLRLELWLQMFSQNLLLNFRDQIESKESMLFFLGAIFSYLELSPDEIYKTYFSQKIHKEYLKERPQFLFRDTPNSQPKDNTLNPSFYEIIDIVLIDEPDTSYKYIKETAFLIMDDALGVNKARAS